MTPPASRARPTGSPAPERTKVLSVRLTEEEFELLVERATQVGVGPSTLTRTLVRSGLRLDIPPSSSALEDELHRRIAGGAPHDDLERLARRVAALESRLDELTGQRHAAPGPAGG